MRIRPSIAFSGKLHAVTCKSPRSSSRVRLGWPVDVASKRSALRHRCLLHVQAHQGTGNGPAASAVQLGTLLDAVRSLTEYMLIKRISSPLQRQQSTSEMLSWSLCGTSATGEAAHPTLSPPAISPLVYPALTLITSISLPYVRHHRTLQAVPVCFSRAYTAAERFRSNGSADSPPQPSGGPLTPRTAGGVSIAQHLSSSQRFARHRGGQRDPNSVSNAERQCSGDIVSSEVVTDAFRSTTPPSSCSSPSSDAERGPALRTHSRHDKKSSSPRDAPSQPALLREGRRNAQRKQPRVTAQQKRQLNRGREEEEVLTEWAGTNAQKAPPTAETAAYATRASLTPQKSAREMSAAQYTSLEVEASGMAAASAARATPATTNATSHARELRRKRKWRRDQQNAATTPVFAKTNNADYTLSRRLMREHTTFAKNFATLKHNTAVVDSLERLGTEAIARSGVLEALAAVFCGSPDAMSDGTSTNSSEPERNTRDNAAAGSPATPSSSSVRLVLTHISHGGSSAAQGDDAAAEVAVLEVSPLVVAWLNTPIECPPLSPAEMMSSVEKGVAQLVAVKAHRDSVPPGTEAARDGHQRPGEDTTTGDHCLNQWYAQWGAQQQCGQKPQKQHQRLEGRTSAAVESSLTEEGMSLWYERHVALSQVLLMCFHDVCHSLPAGGPRTTSTADGGGVTDTCRAADWRDLPRTVTAPDPQRQLAVGQDRLAPPTRPDETVSDEMRLLLEALDGLLQTLTEVKSTVEGTRLLLHRVTVPAGQGGAARRETHDATEGATRTSSGDANAAVNGGEAVTSVNAFAKLQSAVLQLQQTVAHVTATSSPPTKNKSPPVQHTPNDGAGTASEAVAAAQEQVRRASEQWLSVVSPIDVLREVHGSAQPINQSPNDTVCNAALSSSPPSSFTTVAHTGDLAHTPLFTMTAVDLLLSVVLRCSLFYAPAIQHQHFLRVVQHLTGPWVSRTPRGRVFLWATQFALSSLLTTCAAAERILQRRSCEPCGDGVAAGQLAAAGDCANTALLHIASVLLREVELLRQLCWPTASDYRSKVISQLFHLPMITSQTAKGASGEGGGEECASQHRYDSWHISSLTSPSPVSKFGTTGRFAWMDVVYILRSTPTSQRAGYELMLFFLTAATRAGVFDTVSQDVTMRSTEQESSHAYAIGSPARKSDENDLAGVPSRRSAPPRRVHRCLMQTCFMLIDVDRYVTENVCMQHHTSEKSPACLFSLPSSATSSLPCTQKAVWQMLSPHGLARQTISLLFEPLREAWGHVTPTKIQVLWDAFRYAAVTPAASLLFPALNTTTAQSAANANDPWPLGIANTSKWQAVAQVLRSFRGGTTPATWAQICVHTVAQLTSFPAQMKVTLAPVSPLPAPVRGALTAESPPLSDTEVQAPLRKMTAQASGDEDTGAAGALRSCWVELSELAVTCAWLVITAEGFVAAAAASKEGEVRVTNAFAACVTNVLAVCTELGIAADAGQQLLQLFDPLCVARSKDGAVKEEGEEQDAPVDESLLLLRQLLRALGTHVWTPRVANLMRRWEAQTRHAQQQVPPRLVTDRDTRDAATDGAMEGSSSPGRSLEGLKDADPCIAAWWRSLQAEDAGLPSVHVYLLQVFTELQRIAASRGGVAGGQEKTATEDHPTIMPVRHEDEHKEEGLVVEVNVRRDTVTPTTGTCKSVTVDKDDTAAATRCVVAPSAILTCAELAVVLRVLASISTRVGVLAAAFYVGVPLNANRTCGDNRSPSATTSTSSREGSILESLYRVAVHHAKAAAAAPATTTTGNEAAPAVKSVTPGEMSSSVREGRDSGIPSPNVVESMDAIEKMLLSSIALHAPALSAASLVEAVWLGLHPLSNLSDRFYKACTHAAGSGVADSNSVSVESEEDAVFTDSLMTLRTVSASPWLNTLHTDICNSAHTRLICCFMLYRHYNVLCFDADGECGKGNDCAATAPTSGSSNTVLFTTTLADECPSQLTSLARFFRMVSGSCTEALVRALNAAGSAKTSRSTNPFRTKAAVSANSIREGSAVRGVQQKVTTERSGSAFVAAATATVADGTANGGSESRQATATLLKDQAQHFLQVFVLCSEMHHRLSELEAHYGNPLLAGDAALLSFRTAANEKAAQCRVLTQLYPSLLAASEAYLAFGERGYCTDVLQMTSVITWRMLHLVVLPVAATPPMEDADVPADMFRAAAGPLFFYSSTGRRQLRRFCDLAQGLMPYVDRETLVVSKSVRLSLIKLVVIISAKAAMQHVTRAVQAVESPSCTQSREERDALSPQEISTRTSMCPTTAETKADVYTPSRANTPACENKVVTNSLFSAPSPSSSSVRTLPYTTKPIWSIIPLESLVQQIASDHSIAARHTEEFCAVAVVAPELAIGLLPTTNVLRDQSCRFGAERLEVTFRSIVACVDAHYRQRQQELYGRESVSLMPASVGVATGTRITLGSTGIRSDQVRDVVYHDSRSNSSSHFPSGEQQAAMSSLSSSAASIGDAPLSDTSRVVDQRSTCRVQEHVSLFRSAAALPTLVETPMQLRRLWATLSRRMLEGEVKHDMRSASLWLTALHCGGAVGMAETQVFEELLASFVLNPIAVVVEDETGLHTGDDRATTLHEGSTRIAEIGAAGWTLLIKACATASDHHYRQGYRDLLMGELVGFLNQLNLPVLSGAATSSTAIHTAGALLSRSAPALCALLEAIPQLFVEDANFWGGVVKGAVLRCCDKMMTAAGGDERSAEMVGTAAVLAEHWSEQWQRSFNWAVTSAGHASLAFPDVLTDTTEHATAQEVGEALLQHLQSLQKAFPVGLVGPSTPEASSWSSRSQNGKNGRLRPQL